MKRLLITGARGFVGSYLASHFASHYEIVRATSDAEAGKRDGFVTMDIRDPASVKAAIAASKPDVVFHCAAMKNVKVCEQDPDGTYAVNVSGARNVAEACKDSFLVYLSSDYVFAGDRGHYSLDDPPEPRTVYGKTKLEGERFAKAGAVIRTGGLYSQAGGLLKFMVEQLRTEQRTDFSDVINSPTSMHQLATGIDKVLFKPGTYHLVASQALSRYEFALRVARVFELDERYAVPSTLGPERGLFPHDVSLKPTFSIGTPEEGLAHEKAIAQNGQ